MHTEKGMYKENKKINELGDVVLSMPYLIKAQKGSCFYKEHMSSVCILIGKCRSANQTEHNSSNKKDSIYKCPQDQDYVRLSNSSIGFSWLNTSM